MTNSEKYELLERENAQLTVHLVAARQRVADLEAVISGDIDSEPQPVNYVTCKSVDGYSVEYNRDTGKVVAE